MKATKLTLTLVLALLMIVSTGAYAQEEILSVTVTVDAEGITVPDDIPGGMVNVVYDNVGEAPFFPAFLRLSDGTTMEDFMTAMMEAGPEAVATMGTLKGGVLVMPQASGSVTYTLEAGEYLLINFFSEEPQIANFTIEDGEMADVEEPEADISVNLYDFAFGIPLEIPAGEQTWVIENFGMQWHEMAVFSIDPEMTRQEILDLLSAEDEESLPNFVWSPSSEGEKAWVSVNLEPGTYVVACFLPDVSEDSEGHVHWQNGMLQIITVTGE